MKKIYLLGFALSSMLVFSQVGIDTNNPQQQFHVSGTPAGPDANGVVEPTIRVDGLNQTNNPANSGDLSPVYVNADGDIVLMDATTSSGYGYLVGDNLPNDDILTADAIVAIYRSGRPPVVRNLGVYDFTLPTTCLVHFNKTITFNFAFNSTTTLSDGKPRFADTEWKISQAPDNALLGKVIARDGVVFTSHDGSTQSGYLWATGSESIILPAGNYRIRLDARVYSNETLTNYDYMVQIGGGDFDEISIIAEPWPY